MTGRSDGKKVVRIVGAGSIAATTMMALVGAGYCPVKDIKSISDDGPESDRDPVKKPAELTDSDRDALQRAEAKRKRRAERNRRLNRE